MCLNRMLIYCAVILTIISQMTVAIVGPANNGTKLHIVHKTDTYLEAYSKSRIDAENAKQGVVIVTAKDGEKKITNRDDSFPYTSGYDYTPAESSSYLPQSSYSPVKFNSETTYNSPPNTYPPSNYGPPQQSYGPPAQIYGPPAQAYGPPQQTYGPPLKPIYGPPKQTYGVPYSTGLSFFDKLALKLDILTVAKLILKFFIFKKIVTFIGVLCMLLVIPKLINFKKDGPNYNNNNDDDEDERTIRGIELSTVQQLFDRAMTVYGQQRPECGIACRVRTVIDDIYQFQPYFRLSDEKKSTKSSRK